MQKNKYLILIFLSCILFKLQAQSNDLSLPALEKNKFQNLGIKFGFYGSNQIIEGSGSLPLNTIGQYPIFTQSFLLFYEFQPEKAISFQLGLGYRQRGFKSEFRYEPSIQKNVPNLNNELKISRFGNLNFDFIVKITLARKKDWKIYFLAGNRIDRLISYDSPFWGENSAYYSRIQWGTTFGIGGEYKIKKFGTIFIETDIDTKFMTVMQDFDFKTKRVIQDVALGMQVGLRF